ncbi:endonuclease [Mycoplasmopsis iners]|uniref:endonuclease n=1 Tax=Mycoplasmopsis iners TaxID=76630 RepID=UPI00068E2BBA|nr:endonuclease [Mycoplasmopsis iners]
MKFKTKLNKMLLLSTMSFSAIPFFISAGCSNQQAAKTTTPAEPIKEDEKDKNDSGKQNNAFDSRLVYDSTNNYYAPAQGKRGAELWEALFAIQQAKRTQIGNNYGQLYDIYKNVYLDKFFEKDNTILDIYSEIPDGQDPYEFVFENHEGNASDGSGVAREGKTAKEEGYMYNREHMIPQSWFNKEPITRSDPHFVLPTDKLVNNRRDNKPHFVVENPTWTSLNGTKIDSTFAEPIDVFKGDTARIYFYFQLTHKNANNPKSEAKNVFKDVFPYFTDQFLTVYKQWDKQDEVDQIEVYRNKQIAAYYTTNDRIGLRNPFIDYPNLPELIWGEGNETFVDRGVLIDIK